MNMVGEGLSLSPIHCVFRSGLHTGLAEINRQLKIAPSGHMVAWRQDVPVITPDFFLETYEMGAGLSHIPIFLRFIRSVFVAPLSCCVAAELFIALVSWVY